MFAAVLLGLHLMTLAPADDGVAEDLEALRGAAKLVPKVRAGFSRAYVRRDLAAAMASCGDTNSAKDLLRQAIEDVETGSGRNLRGTILAQIAQTQATCGDLEGAAQTIRKARDFAAMTDDPNSRVSIRVEAAKAEAQCGHFDAARAAAKDAINNSGEPFSLKLVGEKMRRWNDVSRMIEDIELRAAYRKGDRDTIGRIVASRLAASKFALMDERGPGEDLMDLTRLQLTRTQAGAYAIDEARATADKIPDSGAYAKTFALIAISQAQLEMGTLPAAAATARAALPHARRIPLQDLAMRFAALKPVQDRAHAIALVVAVLARAEGPAGAAKVAEALDDLEEKALALAAIAEHEPRDAARARLAKAEAPILAHADPLVRERILTRLAISRARAGVEVDIEEVANRIKRPDDRDSFRYRVADATAQRGDLDRAREILATVPRVKSSPFMMNGLINRAAGEGHARQALALIGDDLEPGARSMAISALAEGIVDHQNRVRRPKR